MARIRRAVHNGEQYLHTGDLVAMLREEAPTAVDPKVREAFAALANMLAARDQVTGGGVRPAPIQTTSGLLLPPS